MTMNPWIPCMARVLLRSHQRAAGGRILRHAIRPNVKPRVNKICHSWNSFHTLSSIGRRDVSTIWAFGSFEFDLGLNSTPLTLAGAHSHDPRIDEIPVIETPHTNILLIGMRRLIIAVLGRSAQTAYWRSLPLGRSAESCPLLQQGLIPGTCVGSVFI